jgi:hypothetical protein
MTVKILVLKSGEDVIADVQEMVSSDNKVIGYFLTKPCVVKMRNTSPLTIEETDPKKPEKKSEFQVSMYPWMPLAREKSIPLTTDWVVTMVTPVEKIYEMYVEDVLQDGKTNQDPSTDEQSDSDQSD